MFAAGVYYMKDLLFRSLHLGRLCLCAVVIAVSGAPAASLAVTILSGPSFTKFINSPLAGSLELTTDVPARVRVSVQDGTNVWQRDFFDYTTNHSVPLFGFKPSRTNQLTVTVLDQLRNQATAPNPVRFVTGPLPLTFPIIHVLHSEPARMEPGYTLVRVELHTAGSGYAMILDSAGEVVWYSNIPAYVDVRMLENGHLFMNTQTNFMEMDLLGNLVSAWPAQPDYPINDHEALPTARGTILYLSDATMVVTNFPSSSLSNAPLVTATISYQNLVEISTHDASLVNTWSPVTQLDPRRITYLVPKIGNAWDSEHANAIIEDPRDDSLIVSLRAQNAVVKFSRATGKLKWILGPHELWGEAWQPFLLTPVGTPFGWQYGQHAPILTTSGTLMLFDDGNFRASPFQTKVADSVNYSRAVEYRVNEKTMEVYQVWDYGRTNMLDRLYVDHEGNAEPEPQTGNVLIDFSAVNYVNGQPPSSFGRSAYIVRLTEVTHDDIPEIVFDVQLSENDNPNYPITKDVSAYRAHRIPDLYAHPARPVGDLTLAYLDAGPTLAFSADPARSYLVQSSTNLVDWDSMGLAIPNETTSSDFEFVDDQYTGPPCRYYRIVTQ